MCPKTVLAVDASPEMVRTAVTCRIAAHHFPDPEAFVDEVARILRPGGPLAFEDNVSPDDPDLEATLNRLEKLRDPTHVHSHRTGTWVGWLEARGFDLEEVVHFKKRLDFSHWIEAQSLEADRRADVTGVAVDPDDEDAASERGDDRAYHVDGLEADRPDER